jgi:multidrug efflux pump subunit AcrA (membrane-fusion protein)
MLHGNTGAMAAPELPLVTIGDLSNLIVKLDIPEKYYEIFRTGKDMSIKIIRPQSGRPPFEAEILNISPVINPETKNFRTTCRLKGDLSPLRPGMFVYCDFELDSLNDAFYLPHKTLGPGNSLWYVDPENLTARKTELPEIFANADYFVIPDEMSNFDFIIEGQSFLQPGRNIVIR